MELDSLATEVNKILVTFTEREKNKGLGARKTSNDNIAGNGRIKVYQCIYANLVNFTSFKVPVTRVF